VSSLFYICLIYVRLVRECAVLLRIIYIHVCRGVYSIISICMCVCVE
jgi:hypothetical protein